MIKVGLIEENYFLLNNFKEFLQDFPDIKVVFSFNLLDQLSRTASIQEPDVVLLDFKNNPVQAVLEIFPNTRVIILSNDDDEKHIVQSLRSGASGFLIKNSRLVDLYSSIKDVVNAGACLSPGAAKILIDHLKGDISEQLASRLTKREMELVTLLKEGYSYKEMAARLFVSVYTINHHLKNIYQKLGVESKSELISRIFQKTL
jgi:DNA-binding NarL/FixJ family response regulator